MSTERELLELAAKAAGIKTGPYPSAGGALWDESDPQNHKLWNPLEDDGDALRLAVKLCIYLLIGDGGTISAGFEREELSFKAVERYMPDPYAATRLAIVRAAAESGKKM